MKQLRSLVGGPFFFCFFFLCCFFFFLCVSSWWFLQVSILFYVFLGYFWAFVSENKSKEQNMRVWLASYLFAEFCLVCSFDFLFLAY